jgi:putative sigma-54 modulation protein
MQFSVTFRHLEPSEALKAYARDRLQRIKKYFPDPIAVNVVLSQVRYNHQVDVNLQLHNGFKIAGHESTENMYSSIDMVAAKIERQVRRYKGKLQQHKTKSTFEAVPYSHKVLHEGDEVVEETEATSEPIPVEPVVVHNEEFHAEPLTTAEAVMQLNLLHKEFLVYRDSGSGQVSVVYRLEGGKYGLIETPPA